MLQSAQEIDEFSYDHISCSAETLCVLVKLSFRGNVCVIGCIFEYISEMQIPWHLPSYVSFFLLYVARVDCAFY